MICLHRFRELAKALKKQFLGGRLETEIVYFVNVIDAKLQKAATILLARQPGLGLAKSK